MLKDLTLEGFQEVLASDSPAPGGGSVAALSGNLGASLVSMVCALTIGKKGYEDHQETASEIKGKSEKVAEALLHYVDADTEAFNGVMAAFKMPKETDEEKALRSSAIQAGYKEAINSPLSIAESCLETLELAYVMVDKGNKNALSDIGVGAHMAYSGLEGAIMNVEINLPSVKDQDFVEDMNQKIESMGSKGKDLRDKIESYVKKALKS